MSDALQYLRKNKIIKIIKHSNNLILTCLHSENNEKSQFTLVKTDLRSSFSMIYGFENRGMFESRDLRQFRQKF